MIELQVRRVDRCRRSRLESALKVCERLEAKRRSDADSGGGGGGTVCRKLSNAQ